MNKYCQTCGQTFFCRKDDKKSIKKMEKRLKEHEAKCFCPPWDPSGCKTVKNKKKDLSLLLSYWQIKRLVLIRDSKKDGSNPWDWHPMCQSCGFVSEYDVNSNLNGTSDIEIHHIIPRRRRGLDVPENMLVLCHKCHKSTYKKNYAGVPNIAAKEQMVLEKYQVSIIV